VPLQFVAVKVISSFPQISVLLAVITGAVGGVPVLIVIVLDTDDVPHELTQVAV
jgi:NhaP-type Na+/H+ or K+/H+ antiporter